MRSNTKCFHCGIPLYRKRVRPDLKSCCEKCRSKINSDLAKRKIRKYNESYIEKWKKGEVSGLVGKKFFEVSDCITKYLRDKYKGVCSRCGWGEINQNTGKVPLQVEHIDGNWENCKEENLTLLCPNCHSLTPTYGGANRGKGRSFRYKVKES